MQCLNSPNPKKPVSALQARDRIQDICEETVMTAAEARSKLGRISEVLRSCGEASTAMADTLLLVSRTQTFFTSAKFDNIRADVTRGSKGKGGAATPASAHIIFAGKALCCYCSRTEHKDPTQTDLFQPTPTKHRVGGAHQQRALGILQQGTGPPPWVCLWRTPYSLTRIRRQVQLSAGADPA
jgi:hypothetical protein